MQCLSRIGWRSLRKLKPRAGAPYMGTSFCAPARMAWLDASRVAGGAEFLDSWQPTQAKFSPGCSVDHDRMLWIIRF